MFTSIVFTTLLASSAVLLSHAIVAPNEPGPGDSFNEGASCHIAWAGDTTSGSATAWKGMAIELMSGPNEAMVHLTTVATDQDGTVAGTFDYTCPQVTPNSAIYFYQFSSGGAGPTNLTWTGRFTIAGTDGSTTPPTETEQWDGQTVQWGHGTLVDASSAVAAPTFNSTDSTNSGSSDSASVAATTPNSASASTPSKTSNSNSASLTKTPSTPNSSSNASGTSGAAQSTGSSAAVALGPMALNSRWPVLAVMTISAMAFTLLL